MADQLARGLFANFAATEKPFAAPNGMEENLRYLDDHIGLYTLTAPVAPGSDLPVDPDPGDGQIFTDGTYSVFNAGTWVTYRPRRGLRAVAANGIESWMNTGTGWEQFSVVATGPAVAAAEEARDDALLARDAAMAAGKLYASKAAAQADAGLANGASYIAPLPDGSLQAYRKDSGAASTAIGAPFPSSIQVDYILSTTGKNLFDKSQVQDGIRYSPGSNAVIAAATSRMSGWIPVVAGRTYIASGFGPGGGSIGFYASKFDANSIADVVGGAGTAPVGATYAVFNIHDGAGAGVSTWDDTSQFEEGTVASSYEPYQRLIPPEKVKGPLLAAADILESYSYNMIDPEAADYVKRYSVAQVKKVTDAEGIAASDYIPVTEGEWYTLSGDGLFSPRQGGYFAGRDLIDAVSNITFVANEGGSASFQVPLGEGITHVVINLRKLDDLVASTSLDGDVQLERGQIATSWRAYAASTKVKPTLIPDTAGATSGSAAPTIYNLPPTFADVHRRLPQWVQHLHRRNKNVNILLVGDSILAREYHTTDYPVEEQTKRPPLLTSKNIASRLWDRLNWNNSEYSRYDRSGVFSETGGFVTVTTSPSNVASNGINDSVWDDFNNRPGHTRMFSGAGAASVQYVIAAGTYNANFIYRTDLLGCEVCTVAIAEGNGKVQVFNGAAWVEANGFTFSMRHPAVSANRGTTKFQARLRMRTCDKHEGGSFDQRAGAKTITITKSDVTNCRFMYWGIETSRDAYILKMINAARGSMNITTMLPYHEDDVADWINEPDAFTLVVSEIYFNEGMNTYGSATPYATFKSRWDSYFYDTANPLSFKSLSKVGPDYWKKCEALIFNPNPSAEAGAFELVEPFGWATWMHAVDGTKSAYNNFMQYFWDYLDNHSTETGLVFCNVTQALIDEAKAKFGREFYRAFQASGVSGGSFLNDITHPNDYGCAVMSLWLYAALHSKVA